MSKFARILDQIALTTLLAGAALLGCGVADGTPRDEGTSEAAADDDCGGSPPCAAEPPAGWSGPAALYVGDARPEACPRPFADSISGWVGDPAPAYTCGACSCGPATGVTCSPPTVLVYDNSACGGEPVASALLDEYGSCQPIGGGYGAIAQPSAPLGGSCTPLGGGLVPSQPSAEGDVLLCSGAPAGAATGAACIYRDGGHACPSEFPRREVVYRTVVDQRSCSPCSCAPPAGGCGVLVAHATETCADGAYAEPLPVDGECHTDTYYSAIEVHPGTAPVGATTYGCEPGGGEPIGAVHAEDPLTVCCRK